MVFGESNTLHRGAHPRVDHGVQQLVELLARLKAPGFGRLYLALSLSRFTRILGTLLTNGIPLLQALRIALK